jgi:hypothetical protein
MLLQDGTWYLFFEVLNSRSEKGEIGVAKSSDGLCWTYSGIVLHEPFHLAYPYVFKHNDSCCMIPESRRAGEVRLYSSTHFPFKWQFVATLLEGNYADASLVQYAGRWWMFAQKNWDALTLHYADELLGPWFEHPASPIISDRTDIVRPAGRVLCVGNTLLRFAQNGRRTYGESVHAFVVDEIDIASYCEHEVPFSPILTGSGHGWNARGMHHVDAHPFGEHAWLACADGWNFQSRPAATLEWLRQRRFKSHSDLPPQSFPQR